MVVPSNRVYWYLDQYEIESWENAYKERRRCCGEIKDVMWRGEMWPRGAMGGSQPEGRSIWEDGTLRCVAQPRMHFLGTSTRPGVRCSLCQARLRGGTISNRFVGVCQILNGVHRVFSEVEK